MLREIKPVRDYRYDEGITPVVSSRAPTTKDKGYELGTLWVDKTLDDVYVLTSVKNNAATWTGTGGGTGSFSNISVNPGDATITSGNLLVSAGTVTVTALAAGVVQTSGAGTLGSSKGTNGQVLIGSTSGVPAWAALTSGDGSISVTNGSNTIDIRATGGTSSSYVTDSGTATPVLGAINILGGTNIGTVGAGANVTINLDDAITTVGKITAGVGLEMSAGVATITSTTNAVKSIYLHANAGTTETIEIYSDQGNAVDSVYIHSDDGGLTLTSGLATADAINITASNAAGGIDIDAGTNGINIAAANGPVSLISGTGAVNVGADSAAHTVTVGSTTGGSITTVQAGAGALSLNGGGILDIDSVGAVSINSSTGVINIGNGNVDQNISIGTQGARNITIGSDKTTSSFTLTTGTGNVAIATNGTQHNTTIGSTTGSSAFTAQTGTGAMTFTAGGVYIVNATGAATIDSVAAVEINSSGAAISIGQDPVAQNINIGTGGATRVITVGNSTGATQIDLNCGTGGVNVGTSATAHTVTVGSTNSTSATAIQAGSGALTLVGSGAITADATGVVELNSSGAAISIGNDPVSQNINIGTGAAARSITIGNITDAASVTLNCGTGGVSVGASATAHTTTVGSTNTTSTTTIQAGTGGIGLSAAGAVSMTPATNSVAGVAITLNARVGQATFTGQTTGAGASQEFTINNSAIAAATTAIFVTAANLGANDAQMTVTRVVPSAGAVVVTLTNHGAAALNGDVHITFWVIN